MLRVFLLAISLCALASLAQAEPIERSEFFVKDGDTIIKADGKGNWAKDQEYRLVDFDTPETAKPRAKCPAEIEKGMRAAARLIAILEKGSLDLTEVKCSCSEASIASGKCNYGRRCGLLTVNGKDVGDTLIAEGHAVPYTYSKKRRSTTKNHSWCDSP